MALAMGVALMACRPVSAPGNTGSIELIDTETVGGYELRHYRNLAYPCSVEGHQTFTVFDPIDAEPSEERPLFVLMRGGGLGWFDADGIARPGDGKMRQQGLDFAIGQLQKGGITGKLRDSERGFRALVVSMCSHDIYAGTETPDRYNPRPRATTNGLLATKAAIAWTLDHRPTSGYVIRGGSAGSVGSTHVAWGIEAEGRRPPAGIIADSGVLNEAFEKARVDQLPGCSPGDRDAAALPLIEKRLSSQVLSPTNHPEDLVSDGRLTVPLMHVWNSGDLAACGTAAMSCPVGDDLVVLGATDCLHEPLRRAIDDVGEPSRNLRVCLEGPVASAPCDRHGVTNGDDFAEVDEVYQWVLDRLDEDSASPTG